MKISKSKLSFSMSDKTAVMKFLENTTSQDEKFAIAFLLDESLYDDADFMVEFLLNIREYDDNSYYCLASPRLQKDRNFALKICDRMAVFFKDFPDELRNDEEILKAAIDDHFPSFNHASDNLRNNLPLCRELMKYYPKIYPYLPEPFKTDLLVVELSAAAADNFLHYSEAVKSDKKFLRPIISRFSYQAADISPPDRIILSPEILADEEISLLLVSRDCEQYNVLGRSQRINLEVIKTILERFNFSWADGLHTLAVQLNSLSLEISQTRLEPNYTRATLLEKTTSLISQQLHQNLKKQKALGLGVGEKHINAGLKPAIQTKKTSGNRI